LGATPSQQLQQQEKLQQTAFRGNPADQSANKPLGEPKARPAKKPLAAMLALLFATAALSPASPAMADPVSVKLQAQPLGESLKQFAKSTGISVVFDNELVAGKTAPAINDYMEPTDAFRRLLMGTGLQAVMQGDTAVIRRAASGAENETVRTKTVDVRSQRYHEIGPMPGLALTKEQIPGNVQSISAQEIKDSNSISLTDLMNSKLQSVTVNDYQGNPFQMDLQYRGFTAGPQIGTPQGLSVFFDGIRVNEPFGDVVNWDLIPMNALAGFDVFPGSNPIFGLGTLGGAVAMRTKDGFNYPGLDAEVLAGSFGRKQLQVSGGINNANTDEEGSWDNGDFALFGAGSFFMEDGWRDNSPSRVNQVFGKASYRGEKLDLNLNTLLVKTDLVGNGLIPSEMYRQDREGVFTSPDTTENTLVQFQASGSYWVTDNFNITAQAYKRKSRRHAIGADVYTEHGAQKVLRNLRPGEVYTCLFDSDNEYGLPNYYLLPLRNPNDWFDPVNQEFIDFAFMGIIPPNTLNADLGPDATEFVKGALENFHGVLKNYREALRFRAQNGAVPPLTTGPVTPYSNGEPSWVFDTSVLITLRDVDPNDNTSKAFNALQQYYFYDTNGVKHLLAIDVPNNAAQCAQYTQGPDGTDATGFDPLEVPYPEDPTQRLFVDGAAQIGGNGAGVVDGTPTAVLTDTQIDQEVDGASIQLNWNFEKHKFMIGASIDAPSATYDSGQMLGLLDAQRNVYLAPDEIRDQYAAADQMISNNNFEGNQLTKSIYFSETWSPVETLHLTGAARYNETRGKNTIASRTFGFTVFDLGEFEAFPNEYDVCIDGVCPTTGYIVPDATRLLNAPETEKFSYYSLNPSLGVSWQAKPALNIYSNWAKGTRVPSVIELGCAFDPTPVVVNQNPDGSLEYLPRSLAENRSCSLPSTLSGDPYLPQIKATTLDFGLRGNWSDNVTWNLGVYRTELEDDIYLITFPGNRSFFATVGDTWRQGLEAGITASFSKFRLSVNYSMTEATFRDRFRMAADNNSSSEENLFGNEDYGRSILVRSGSRMPGVPLHNLNATLTYEVTPKWQVGLTAVAHSMSYVRGNENNEHRQGVTLIDTYRDETTGDRVTVRRRPASNPGTVDGYMVFNFQTSYKVAPEWTLGLQVNNIFDKEYFTAGRLGRNPFSPSVNGAIGVSGYNHNSGDWLSTNFLAPGAPRAAWLSLTYEFDPRR